MATTTTTTSQRIQASNTSVEGLALAYDSAQPLAARCELTFNGATLPFQFGQLAALRPALSDFVAAIEAAYPSGTNPNTI